MNDVAAPKVKSILVWDFSVRLFHWALFLCVVILITTAQLGGNWMEWHERAGYVALGLLLYRVVWGFVGTFHARFANFVKGPKQIWAYLRGQSNVVAIGHNPLGGLSVVAMLVSLLTQAITGLYANDDILLEGPLAAQVSKATSDLMTRIHHLNAKVIYVLIALHLLAIAWYVLVKKDNLVKPMLTGKKTVKSLATADFDEKMAENQRRVRTSLLVAVAVALGVYWVVSKNP